MGSVNAGAGCRLVLKGNRRREFDETEDSAYYFSHRIICDHERLRHREELPRVRHHHWRWLREYHRHPRAGAQCYRRTGRRVHFLRYQLARLGPSPGLHFGSHRLGRRRHRHQPKHRGERHSRVRFSDGRRKWCKPLCQRCRWQRRHSSHRERIWQLHPLWVQNRCTRSNGALPP